MEAPRNTAYRGRMNGTPDEIIAAFAARQHGMVARRQLLEAGIATHAIESRVRAGRLVRVARGVYRVGPLQGVLAPEWTAVLAAADGAALADRSAGKIWDLATSAPPASAVTRLPASATSRLPASATSRLPASATSRLPVSATSRLPPSGMSRLPPSATSRLPASVCLVVPGNSSGRSPVPGVRRRRDLLPDEITRRDGLPVTTPARTLLDLGRAADRAAFEDAVAEALRRRIVTRDSLREMVARHPRHRGAAALAAVIGDGAATASRSEAERRVRALCANGGLPAPEVNAHVHGFEVDLFFRTQRVAIEMDGFAFHNSAQDFHRDRRRDSVLAAAGILVMRVTWRHLTRERDATLVRIAQTLVLRDPAVRTCACGRDG
jgi:very-short-patch-repair endonuclease